jgi:hypothetical protein
MLHDPDHLVLPPRPWPATTARRYALFAPLSEAAKAAIFIIAVHFVITLGLAIYLPTSFKLDEVAHISAVISQHDHPSLFPHYASQRLLIPPELTRWSTEANYINHPSLLYLLLAPLAGLPHALFLMRLVNVLISCAAIAVTVRAGWQLLGSSTGRLALAVIAASFPKSALVGATINNDNLAALAAAMVFAGLASTPPGLAWLGIGLAVAGWTKLSAFIALAAAAGVVQLWRLFARRTQLFGRETAVLLAALAIGSIPYLVELFRSGHPLYVAWARAWVPPAERPDFGILAYALYFVQLLTFKWEAAEGSMPVPIAAICLITPLLLAAYALARPGPTRRLGVAYFTAVLVTFAIHLHFGWQAFEKVGDLTIPQARYYNILWPGIALGGAVAIAMIARRSRSLAALTTLLYLVPTALGGIFLALI